MEGRSASESPKRNERLESWSGGEFHPSGGKGSVQQEIARRQFLLVASEIYGVTAELRDKVLPLYRQQDDGAAGAMKTWCNRFRLSQPWVFRQLDQTLHFWTQFPGVAQLDKPNPPWHPLFDVLIRRPRPETTVRFVFSYQSPTFEIMADRVVTQQVPAGWDLELDRKERFVAEARKQFEAALKSYCAEQERSAQQKGLIRVKRSRTRGFSLASKMRWTVQRHCGQMTFEEVAAHHVEAGNKDVDPSTVIKAVNEISDLIDLTCNPL